MDEKKKPSFFKRVFALKDIHLPPIHLRFPNWKTPEINLRMPSFGGWQPPNLKIASVRGMTITGGVWKVGTWGLGLGLLVTGFAIGTSVVFTRAAPHFPEPAQYYVAAVEPDRTLKVGKDWEFEDTTPSDVRETQVNTLQLNMSGARAADITMSDLEIGKADLGQVAAIQVVGSLANNSAFYLECDEIIIQNVEAKTLNLANSEIYTINILNNVSDGISLGPTLNSAVLDITVTSTRGSVKVPAVTTGSFDKIIIDTQTASSQCKTLTISNVSAFGSGIDLDHIKAGTLTISGSKIGSGSGINSPDFVIANTTKIQVLNATGNTEAPVSVK